MAIDIKPVKGTELYLRYPRQSAPQPCHVELDARGEGSLTASPDPVVGSGVPFDVYHQHVLRVALSRPLRADAANRLLAELAPLAERVVAGYSREWDGQNVVARYTDDAIAAHAEIERRCDLMGDDGEALVIWAASDYYAPLERGSGDARLAAVGREIGITARTSDARLAVIQQAELDKATEDGVDDIDGLDDYLEAVRSALRSLAREHARDKAA
jgi:hypothetical protein